MGKERKSEAEWEDELTPEQYRVMRRGGTERAFSGKYYDHWERGTYRCAACGNPLFRSEAKFNSGTGWPSFWVPMDGKSVRQERGGSPVGPEKHVWCVVCDAHLGYVYGDGPLPTGRRYCVNSIALQFEEDE